MNTKILLVEDDESMGILLVDFLEQNKFTISLCRDGKTGFEKFTNNNFDLCILDIMLPKMDGFTVAEKIRKLDKNVPIIFLTAKVLKQDKLKGFSIGIDDYITKPFDEDELVCRINSILNRCKLIDSKSNTKTFNIGQYKFDYNNLSLVYNSETKRLTQKESDVLFELAQNKNNVVKRNNILLSIWGDTDYFNGRSLDVFIAKLRKYLKSDAAVSIENIPKVGFILKD